MCLIPPRLSLQGARETISATVVKSLPREVSKGCAGSFWLWQQLGTEMPWQTWGGSYVVLSAATAAAWMLLLHLSALTFPPRAALVFPFPGKCHAVYWIPAAHRQEERMGALEP